MFIDMFDNMIAFYTQNDHAIRLQDTMLTDIRDFCIPVMEETPIFSIVSRDYKKGYVRYNDMDIDAMFIDFKSGNCAIAYLSGVGSKELYQRILRHRRKRNIPLLIRQFIAYFYATFAVAMGFVSLYMLLSFQLMNLFICFLVTSSVRIVYVISRNCIR